MVLTYFEQDVLEGLSSNQKKLSSRYFYDEIGDKIFQQIMNLDEYYLSRAELNIFENQKDKILDLMRPNESFRIVELGAGDGVKTKVLLSHFVEQQKRFSYSPVDISANVLDILKSNLQNEIPDLDIAPLAGDYFQVLSELEFDSDSHNVVYFLGSNIGNFLNESAISFLSNVRENLNAGDRMLIGFDLKKDPNKILAAYNDKQGVTKSFNLNLLTRINHEMGADFDITAFSHNPVYDPATGECRSYLMSLKDQDVHIESLEETFHFKKWETIFVEVSKKYDLEEIGLLAESSGFSVIENLLDDQELFTDSIWEVK
ncbi:MAG: L-histidine N(alpha)-methyltransferase [Cyclobacteriaceae bacterium]